jgi:tetratricopeptide (TPR) repeat protein
MARFDKSRTRGPKPNAAVTAPRRARRQPVAPSIEDTMFFPRMRRHAKWMFVFLAAVFAIGFVGFGVGAGGIGFGDILRNSGGAGGPSVSDARKKTVERPNDAAAWEDLSTALQAAGDTQEAVIAQERVAELRPRDGDGLRALAGLYFALASQKQQEAQIVQANAAIAGASQNFPVGLTANGQNVTGNPIGRAVNVKAEQQINSLLVVAQSALQGAIRSYQSLADLDPSDPSVQLELAQAAEQAGQTDVAIGAYEQFIELAPDDPNVSFVRQQLKTLRSSSSG